VAFRLRTKKVGSARGLAHELSRYDFRPRCSPADIDGLDGHVRPRIHRIAFRVSGRSLVKQPFSDSFNGGRRIIAPSIGRGTVVRKRRLRYSSGEKVILRTEWGRRNSKGRAKIHESPERIDGEETLPVLIAVSGATVTHFRICVRDEWIDRHLGHLEAERIGKLVAYVGQGNAGRTHIHETVEAGQENCDGNVPNGTRTSL